MKCVICNKPGVATTLYKTSVRVAEGGGWMCTSCMATHDPETLKKINGEIAKNKIEGDLQKKRYGKV